MQPQQTRVVLEATGSYSDAIALFLYYSDIQKASTGMDTNTELTTIESTSSALVTIDQEDMQLVDAWLYGKADTTQRAYKRFAWGMLSRIGKPLRAHTIGSAAVHDVTHW